MGAAAPLDGKILTLEEYGRLPDDGDGDRVELVRGMLVRERGPGQLHGRLQSRIAYYLEKYHDARHRRGAVIVNAGFVLAEHPPTVRIPDVAYVSDERIPPARYAERWWRIGPDLVIEVASPSNTWSEIQEKVSDYFGSGTRIVWVVDPATRTVTVYRPDQAAARLEEKDELSGEDVLPDLRIRLAELFEL
jgi:Uma2 family endonuclease